MAEFTAFTPCRYGRRASSAQPGTPVDGIIGE